MTDGTFGTTGEIGALDPALVEAVEAHRFDPLRALHWRSRNLDFRSPRRLLGSLEHSPPVPELIRAREADDIGALAALARDPEIAELAGNPDAVRLLWEVCQVPDFQNVLSDQHARLLGRIYRFLAAGQARLPTDWVARQIDRIDRIDGGIDTLTARIAHIRTWTYVAHRGDWLADSTHWQERARDIEDKLSDALHERLTQRFVDRRAATLIRRLRAGEDLLAAIKPDGEVVVEGEFVGRLEGFRFRLDGTVEGDDAKSLLTAARRALSGEIPARVKRLELDGDEAFALSADGRLAWRGVTVARLTAGENALRPAVAPLTSEFLDGRARERLRVRLTAWLRRHLEAELAPLYRVAEAAAGMGTKAHLGGPARGLSFQLVESLGVVPRRVAAPQIRGLAKADRRALAELGVRLGRESVYLPALIGADPARLRALLHAVHGKRVLPDLPPLNSLAFAPEAPLDGALCQALGYRRFENGHGRAVALRADALERLAHEAYRLSERGVFKPGSRLRRLAGCGEAELETILVALRYRVRRDDGGLSFSRAPARKKRRATTGKSPKGGFRSGQTSRGREADSPFAKLRDLEPGK